MLRKLLKYELRSIYQSMLPLYGAVLVAALINLLFGRNITLQEMASGTPHMIVTMVYVALMIAMITICMITTIQRFYKGLLSEEGYLMFTLPVKPWQHIVSKALSASLMLITSGFIALITFFLIAIGIGVNLSDFFSDFVNLFKMAFTEFHFELFLYFLEFGLLLLIAVEKQILKAYAAMSIGHLFSKHRLPISFVAYVVLGAVITAFWGMLTNSLHSFGLTNIITELFRSEPWSNRTIVHLLLWMIIFCQSIESIAHWIITHTILSKHLNLE